MWTQIRVTGYVMAGLSAGAAIAANLGYGEYDAAAMMFDPPPISLAALGGIISPIVMSAVAAVAAVKGWGRK